jgi:hypothetical protein
VIGGTVCVVLTFMGAIWFLQHLLFFYPMTMDWNDIAKHWARLLGTTIVPPGTGLIGFVLCLLSRSRVHHSSFACSRINAHRQNVICKSDTVVKAYQDYLHIFITFSQG